LSRAVWPGHVDRSVRRPVAATLERRMAGRIELREGDIASEEVDAVVNAANTDLVLGSGVAGAIARAGGPSIQEECAAHGPIERGDVALTGAGDLPARFVIHAAAMTQAGEADEESIRSCVERSLALASQRGLESVALPAIGAGAGGVPLQRCAEVSLEAARLHLAGESSIATIRFVLFGEPAYRLFESVNDAAKVAAQMARLKAR